MRGSCLCFFFSSRRRHTRCSRDWSSDVCSSDLVLDLHGLTGLRGQRFGFSGARLNAGLFIRRDDELVGAQFTALPEALVQIQNASGLGRKLWVSRKDPAAVLPRADGILVQPSPDGGVTEGGGQTTARTWEPSSVTLQRERGTPKRLGNSQRSEEHTSELQS